MISQTQLLDFFVEVADTLVDDFDVIDFCDTLTHRAAEVSGAAAVGLLVADQQGRVRYMASSNEAGKLLELFQIQSEEGPCLDAISTGHPVVNADLGVAGDRWPVFAPAARAAGYQSVHAFPMKLRKQVIGALNIFGTSDVRFGPAEVQVVQALADVATIAIIQERGRRQAEVVTEQLQAALTSRIVIEQAKGALARSESITTAEAFARLRHTARSSGRRLSDVAHATIADLEPPAR